MQGNNFVVSGVIVVVFLLECLVQSHQLYSIESPVICDAMKYITGIFQEYSGSVSMLKPRGPNNFPSLIVVN